MDHLETEPALDVQRWPEERLARDYERVPPRREQPATLSGIPIAIMSGQTHAPTALSGETRLVKPVELDELLSVADRYSRDLARGE